MIVVVGRAAYRPSVAAESDAAEGRACRVARAAARAGANVQLVARIGDDPPGDGLLLALSRDGVGHAAVLRDPALPTSIEPASPSPDPDGEEALGDITEPSILLEVERVEQEARAVGRGDGRPAVATPEAEPALDAGDLELALRYLAEISVLVLTAPVGPALATVAAEAAAFHGAQVVAVVEPGGDVLPELGPATVLEAPSDDANGAFAVFVGRFAADLDAGTAPRDAFGRALAQGGWEPAPT